MADALLRRGSGARSPLGCDHRSTGPYASQNLARVLSKNFLTLGRRQLLKHRQRDGAVRIADLVGKVGAEHDAIGPDKVDQKTQRSRACYDRVVVELGEVMARRLRDVGPTSGVRLVLGRVIGKVEAPGEVG